MVQQSPSGYGAEPLPGTLMTVDPRPLGMGNALIASAAGNSGVYLNPATIAMAPLYHIELMYQFTDLDELHMGGINVVDSVTAPIAAGLSFNYGRIDQSRTSHLVYDGRLALAAAIGKVFFIGMSGKYLHVDQNSDSEHQGPGGVPALPASGSRQLDGFTFDAGLAFRLGELITIGLAGYNLTNTGSVFAPLKLGGGASIFLADMLRIEADLLFDFTSHEDVNEEIHAGTELFLARMVALRAGYSYDVYFQTHAVSAGLGYIDKAFSIEAGFMKELESDSRMALAFGFKYFVN